MFLIGRIKWDAYSASFFIAFEYLPMKSLAVSTALAK